MEVCVRGEAASRVRKSAKGVADEVALAVDLLDQALGLEERQGAAQGRGADLVIRGESGLRREAFAGLEVASGDLGPEVGGDGVGRDGMGRSPPSEHP
ncbi:hypothetical protein GCM10010275_65790 [Streptomyces litmocidini]|nr:hypothetical protein GCM10010275_65790 [Streptomyces litmocidini]